MYSNDLNNAYMYETQRRMDEMVEAANCRLAAECDGSRKNKPGFLAFLPTLLTALVMFFAKRWT